MFILDPDPGSRSCFLNIPDPRSRVKKAPDPGSGSATLEKRTERTSFKLRHMTFMASTSTTKTIIFLGGGGGEGHWGLCLFHHKKTL